MAPQSGPENVGEIYPLWVILFKVVATSSAVTDNFFSSASKLPTNNVKKASHATSTIIKEEPNPHCPMSPQKLKSAAKQYFVNMEKVDKFRVSEIIEQHMTFSNPNTPAVLPKLAGNRNFSYDRSNSQPNLAKIVSSSFAFHKEENSGATPMEEDSYDLQYLPTSLEARDDYSNYSSINSSVNLDDFDIHSASDANMFCSQSQNLDKNSYCIGDNSHQFRYVLNASTSCATKLNAPSVTYLNQGQAYKLTLKALVCSTETVNQCLKTQV